VQVVVSVVKKGGAWFSKDAMNFIFFNIFASMGGIVKHFFFAWFSRKNISSG
jgi:hypothetical protein